MTVAEIKRKVESDECYKFLKTHKHLGNSIIMLGLGGSYAYGTNVETSDIDLRGIALNNTDDLLLGRDFEQVVDMTTDTTIYSLKKAFNLFHHCNPNTIEILGLNKDQILYSTPIWDIIQENKMLFISKRCIQSFGGYANAQLRRLETKSARIAGQAQQEEYILGSIRNAEFDFKSRYAHFDNEHFKLYIDRSTKEEFDTEIMVDLNLHHYPLRDAASLFNDYNSIIRGYDKIGKRNSRAIDRSKLGKHMMHLVRLYLMLFDILEKGEINTYRKEEHELLMSIRNGEYLIDQSTPKPEFYRIVDDLEKRLEADKKITTLPDDPDYNKIDKLYLKIIKELS